MALGDKAVNGGAAPHKLRQDLDKGTVVVAGDGVPLPAGQASVTIRTHYVDGAAAALVTLTSFTRIIIVFHFLRQALGTQEAPSNQILIGLSLFLSFFIMNPTLTAMYNNAYEPWSKGEIDQQQALERGAAPLRQFMLKSTRDKDLQLFMDMTGGPKPKGPAELPMSAIMPAFMISEIKTAFQIGFVLFLPFLVIDMVVSSVLLSMGMMQLPPVMVSLPFKVLLFIMVDGWGLVVSSLVKSYA